MPICPPPGSLVTVMPPECKGERGTSIPAFTSSTLIPLVPFTFTKETEEAICRLLIKSGITVLPPYCKGKGEAQLPKAPIDELTKKPSKEGLYWAPALTTTASISGFEGLKPYLPYFLIGIGVLIVFIILSRPGRR